MDGSMHDVWMDREMDGGDDDDDYFFLTRARTTIVPNTTTDVSIDGWRGRGWMLIVYGWIDA